MSASSSPKSKRQRTGSASPPVSSASPSSVYHSASSASPSADDELSHILFLESVLSRSVPIPDSVSFSFQSASLHSSSSAMMWLPEKEVKALYNRFDDQPRLEGLFADLCRRGFSAESIVEQMTALDFGSDIVFLFDKLDVPDQLPVVLAACIFMRIKKEREIYIELLCSNTRHGMKLLNAFSVYAGQPNAFQDGLTYTNMTLTPANDTLKALYQRHGFMTYEGNFLVQLRRALPYQMQGGQRRRTPKPATKRI